MRDLSFFTTAPPNPSPDRLTLAVWNEQIARLKGEWCDGIGHGCHCNACAKAYLIPSPSPVYVLGWWAK